MLKTEDFPIARVQVLSWIFLAVFTLSGWLAFSWDFAEGIFIGGLLACFSFLLLKNDLTKIFQGPVQAVKVRFFIKYYLRLSALAVILFFLVKHFQVNVFGLLVGLSTIVLSILAAGISFAKNEFLSA